MSLWSWLQSLARDDAPKEPSASPPSMDRAAFFRSSARTVATSAAGLAEHVTRRLHPGVLRPPGTQGEAHFLTTCSRCAACIQACPHNAITRAGPEAKLAVNTPILHNVAEQPCHLCDGLPCVQACPTEALSHIPKQDIRIGRATLDRTTCLAWDDAPCTTCLQHCPFPSQAILIAPNTGYVYIDPNHCTGCGLCAWSCPTDPGSIRITPL